MKVQKEHTAANKFLYFIYEEVMTNINRIQECNETNLDLISQGKSCSIFLRCARGFLNNNETINL